MISEKDFTQAKETIKQYENQINEDRQKLFLDSLKKFDKTYWHYERTFQKIFMSAELRSNSLFVIRYIKNTNGIIEIKANHFDRVSMESYLTELTEYKSDKFEQDDRKYLFKEMEYDYFKTAVRFEIIGLLGLEFEGNRN